jgi:hypothetical protein
MAIGRHPQAGGNLGVSGSPDGLYVTRQEGGGLNGFTAISLAVTTVCCRGRGLLSGSRSFMTLVLEIDA